jgi:hypothetical protein
MSLESLLEPVAWAAKIAKHQVMGGQRNDNATLGLVEYMYTLPFFDRL